MFTDNEIGLSMRHDAETRQNTARSQGIIDELDGDIVKLRAELARTRLALETERGCRIAAEARVEELLDMEI